MTWQLRRAHEADLAAIMQLETSIFENDAWSATMMARDLGDPACYYLVAFPPDDPTRVEGYAGLLASRIAGYARMAHVAALAGLLGLYAMTTMDQVHGLPGWFALGYACAGPLAVLVGGALGTRV